MTTYTLHLPRKARAGEPSGLEEALFVKDGFSWGAFIFNALWFFAHRLWFAGFLVLIAMGILHAIMHALGIPPLAALAAFVIASSLIGLEAGSLRRWTYARRGWPVRDIVSAPDRTTAEAKAFERWLVQSGPLSDAEDFR